MAAAEINGQEKKDIEKQKISCRYFVRGFCREGNNCPYSHDHCDIPVCRYYQKGSCYYGKTCWFRHSDNMFNIASYLENYLVPEENFFSPGIDASALDNINLLMAAAISSTVSETENNERANDVPKEPLCVEKAIEMWNDTTKTDTCDSNKFVENPDESMSALDEMNMYFYTLEPYDIQHWSVDSAVDFLCTIVYVDDTDDISEDFYTGNALYDLLRLWKPSSKAGTEFLCKLCDLKKLEMLELLICVIKYPCRLDDFESFLGEVLFHLYQRNSDMWNGEWLGSFLGKLDSDFECSDLDVVEILSSYGKLSNEPKVLGKVAHTYLTATGLKNSLECRCRTAECTCPVEVDEGVAFILFDGLGRRLQWGKHDKIAFFREAVDNLFTPCVLSQLGESMGIKNAVDICDHRPEYPDDNSKIAQTKCHGCNCPNNAKRECVNNYCGRCCKRSGLWCDVHVDIFPTRYQSVRAHDLVKPRVQLARMEDLDCFLETKEEAKSVCFGRDFSVRDEHVIKVIDLCKSLLVLELGSSDTGCGTAITNKLIDHIVDHCPKLRKLRLESATRINDDAVLKLARNCHNLEFLELSGNDKVGGEVTDRSLKELFDRNVLPDLKALYLTDQSGVSYDLVMRLRRCRSNIEIVAGSTDSDSMAWSLILGMTGADYGDGLF